MASKRLEKQKNINHYQRENKEIDKKILEILGKEDDDKDVKIELLKEIKIHNNSQIKQIKNGM